MKGSEFGKSIESLVRFPAREEAILDAALSGGMLPLQFSEVEVEANGHVAVYRVSNDVFSIGDEQDLLRLPLSPLAAQHLADALSLSLVTKRISDAIWRTAKATGGVVLAPQPIPPDAEMMTVARAMKHNAMVEAARAGRTGLVVGHKKDVVLSNRLLVRPTQVAIYGWHQANGVPIQPLSLVHESTYSDYSHGIRFMEETVTVDGQSRTIQDVATSVEYAALLLDENEAGHVEPLRCFRQPGSFPLGANIRPPGDTEPAPGITVSEGALAEALVDLDRGIHEIPPGSNSGPVIDDYLRQAGVGPHNEWCAAAATAWLKRGAARVGKALPVKGSAGALELGRQLRDALGGVSWHSRPRLEDLAPGAVVIWSRPEAGPGKGHVAIVHSTGQEHFFTIEGNVGDWVAMREHTLTDPNLVGVAVVG